MIENKATVKVIFQPLTCSWGHWRICKEHHHSTRTLLSHLRGWLQRRRRSGVCTGWGLHFQECISQHPVCIGTSWWSSMPVWLKTLLQRGEFFFSHFKSCNSETRVSNTYRWSIHTNLKANQKGQTWKNKYISYYFAEFYTFQLSSNWNNDDLFTSQDCYSSHVESVYPFSICNMWSATPTNSYLR